MTDVRRRPGGRSARIRAAVLQATAEVLAKRGYGRLSVDEVADRAGVHKTTIYRRWATKPDLVLDALLSRSDTVIELPDTGDLESDLLVFLRSVAANLASPLGGGLVVATVRTSAEAPEPASLRHRFWDERFERARARLERAKENGELPPDIDTALVVETLVSPIFFRTFVRGETVDDEFLRSLVRLHTRQLSERGPAPRCSPTGSAPKKFVSVPGAPRVPNRE
jgi:AcrR family transcriptional regulator